MVDAHKDLGPSPGGRRNSRFNQRASIRLLRLRDRVLQVQIDEIATSCPDSIEKSRIVHRHGQTGATYMTFGHGEYLLQSSALLRLRFSHIPLSAGEAARCSVGEIHHAQTS